MDELDAVDSSRPCVVQHKLRLSRRVVSNSGMETPQHTEQRLTDLEIKASFAEDLLDELNKTVFRQQQQIDQLLRELSDLRQRLPEPGAGTQGGARDELPPHY